jgi:hypothetical protein
MEIPFSRTWIGDQQHLLRNIKRSMKEKTADQGIEFDPIGLVPSSCIDGTKAWSFHLPTHALSIVADLGTCSGRSLDPVDRQGAKPMLSIESIIPSVRTAQVEF